MGGWGEGQPFFLCFRLLIFTSIQFISLFTASANNLFHNFPTPLPARRQNNNVRPTPFLICILYLYANFPTINHLLFLK